jgi:hypothetical protein
MFKNVSVLNLIDRTPFFMRVTGFIVFMQIAFIPNAFAQKNQDDAFEQFINAQQNEFDSFVAKQDREFVKMLEDNWALFEGKPPLIRDDVDKPIKAPVIIGTDKPTVVTDLPEVIMPTIPLIPDKAPKSPPEKATLGEQPTDDNLLTEQNPYPQGVALAFFGHQLFLPQVKLSYIESINQQALTTFWQSSAKKDLSTLIKALKQTKQKLQLSDWAYWLMIKQYSELNTTNETNALASAWFIMNQTGYNAQVAFSNERGQKNLVLLMPSKQTLYSVAYFTLSGQRFYQVAGKKSSSITSYKGSFNQNNQRLDLSFNKSLVTQPEIKYRQVKFLTHTFKLPYDYQKVRYLATYPQIDLSYYFKAPIDQITQQGLIEQIPKLFMSDINKKHTEGNSTEAVNNDEQNINLLLSFIHQGFPYEVDDQQFGKENYLTLEETLHYKASDCEDRAIFFAWLVSTFLNEQAVGLSYPGHVSVALKRSGKLVSADPTYIGAKLGDIMPQYLSLTPKIIKF